MKTNSRGGILGWPAPLCRLALGGVLLGLAAGSGAAPPAMAPAGPQPVPLGGIGAGTVELRPDATFGNATINNNWLRPIPRLPGSFFAVRATAAGKTTARVLAGSSQYELPSVASVRSTGAFPVAELAFEDPALPLQVGLKAGTPLLPGDLKDSSLPAADFSLTLTNPSDGAVDSTVALSWENVLGCGGNAEGELRNRTGNIQTPRQDDQGSGLLFASSRPAAGPTATAEGQYALLAEPEGGTVAVLPTWNARGDGSDFWKAFTTGEAFSQKLPAVIGREGVYHPAGVVGVTVKVPARGSVTVRFVLAWYLPVLPTADGKDLGHFYATQFPDAWAVAKYLSQYRDTLSSGTSAWLDLIGRSSIPTWLRRSLAEDLAPLVTNSILTRDGRFTTLENPGESGALGALDQWLLTRSAIAAFFPALERSELARFGSLIGATGEPRRLLGTLDEGFGEVGSPAGAGGWPDVACNYILAVGRAFRTSGDTAALAEAYPGVVRALGWLQSRDTDGDGIPEGGSTFSYRQVDGTFSYTATLYLAALRAAENLARVSLDKKTEEECRERQRRARTGLMTELWNGRYLSRDLEPATGQRSTTLFAGALAGDWAGFTLAQGSTLPQSAAETSIDSLLEIMSGGVVGNEVRTDGSPDPDLTGRLWTGHLLTYVGALGIAQGSADAGLRLVSRVRETALAAGTGTLPRGHISTLGTWNLLTALTGFLPDEPAGRLTLAPSVPTSWDGLHAPCFGTRYWAWMDYSRSQVSAATNLRLKLLKKLDSRPVLINVIETAVAEGVSVDSLTLLVSRAGTALEGKPTIAGGRLSFQLKEPIEWLPGETLEMTLVPAEANNLMLAFGPQRVLSYGSVVTARNVSRTDQIRFSLVNPTQERQLVHVRFRGVQDRQYEVFQNGVPQPRFTPDTEDEALVLTVPASPVGLDRVEALRNSLERIRRSRVRADQANKAALYDNALGELPQRIEAALKADEAAREVQVVLHPFRRLGFFRNRMKEPLPIVTPVDSEPLIIAAEQLLAAAPTAAVDRATDPEVRQIVLGALIPVDVRVTAREGSRPGAPMQFEILVENRSRTPVRGALELQLPPGWIGPVEPLGISVGAGERRTLPALVTPAKDGLSIRRRIAGRMVFLSGTEVTWTVPISTSVGHAYLRDWSVIGTWPAGPKGLETALPPDAELDPTRTYDGRKWAIVRSAGSRLDMSAALGEGMGLAFAVTQVFSSTETDVVLELQSEGGVLVRVNGEKVYQRATGSLTPEKATLKLRQGWNTIIVKLARPGASWTLLAELTDADGNTPPGLRINPDLTR